MAWHFFCNCLQRGIWIASQTDQRRRGMSRRIGFCFLLSAVVALNLFVPGAGRAEEPPALQVTQAEPVLQNLVIEVESETSAPGVCPDPDKQESAILEELRQTFGANKVCGARCTSTTRCSTVCGDAATCRQGYCIYL